MTLPRLSHFYHFIGNRAFWYGMTGIAIGFLSFLCDMAMAMMLQRFFMATGLITLGKDMPLGIPLMKASLEGTAVITTGIIRGILIWANAYVAGLCQTTIEVSKRQELTRWAILSDGQEIGKVMNYYNDIILGSAAAVGNMFYTLARFIMVGGIIIVMATYSIAMTVAVIGIIVIIAPAQLVIDRIISRNSKMIQSSLAHSVSLLSRAVKNNLFLSLHNLASTEVSLINTSTANYGDASIRYYSLNALRTAVPQIVGLCAVVAIALQGHVLFKENPSLLVAFLYMVLRLFQVLSDIGRVSGNLRLNFPRISILYNWWNGLPIPLLSSQPSNIPHSTIGWKADHIYFSWPNGKTTAIHDMSFDIRPASTTLIIGESGSGKTTLFSLLIGLISPTSGQLSIYTQTGVISPITERIPQTISYVGPDPFLIAGTVREQLLLGNVVASDEELYATLSMVHAGFVSEFPDGLGHMITEQGHGLSAGQKQRLALARAILRKPDILLLDEATANLDTETETVIINLLNSFRGKMNILMISHRPHAGLVVDTLIDLNERRAP